ncbi:MAG: PQQ-dependent sugar dehydrogenase [Planctomycetota bacterium]|nr:PQQ-dependent sugar dehydrogenase [Planctomycetota bacterium]
MRIARAVTAAAVSVLGGAAGSALAQPLLNGQLVASGLATPIYVTAPAGDTSRIFVIEQRSGSTGRIRIINIPANTLNGTPYLSISPVSTGSEQGLLGLAFHPNFMQNGYFYVNYTEPPVSGVSAGSTVIARYRATGGNPMSATADAASASLVLRIPQPDANHNGGWIGFGPDGYLYIATGDGGCFNDVTCTAPNPPSAFPHSAGGNAQDITDNLLGKMLRIDVDGADNIPGNADDDGFPADTARNYAVPSDNPFVGVTGDDEIFAFGLRNPWRNAFDRGTGDFWIADVGQDQREEINAVPAGTLAGRNFGWRCMEGTRCTGLSGCTCNAPALTLPVAEYRHSGSAGPITMTGCSITGGYVYRGSAIPCFRGHYIFADFCTPQIWSFRLGAGNVLENVVNRTVELEPAGTPSIANISSFGEDASGELYICDRAGEVFKIVSAGNCPSCEPDINNDGNVDQDDVACLTQAVAGDSGCLGAGIDPDFNQDGNVDQDDIAALEQVVAGAPCP